MKDKEYKYRLFDSILVYSGDKFINILEKLNIKVTMKIIS